MFIPYPHIERLGKDEVEGIIAGTCYIFPKIDGTNASVWSVEQSVRCGSRNRELSLGADNQGFAAWAMNDKKIIDFCVEYPDLRLYGEWLVPHTFKQYAKDAWRKFYVFDVAKKHCAADFVDIPNDGEVFMGYEEYKPILDSCGIEYIPALKIITNPSEEELKHEMNNNFYLCDGRENAGEGIVIKNYEYTNKWGRQTYAKMVREEFKTANLKTFGTPEGGTKKVEAGIIQKYITESALAEKTYHKILNEVGEDKKSLIPRVLETVWHDLITEESYNFLKEYSNPTINFKMLRALCTQATKQRLPQMFL